MSVLVFEKNSKLNVEVKQIKDSWDSVPRILKRLSLIEYATKD